MSHDELCHASQFLMKQLEDDIKYPCSCEPGNFKIMRVVVLAGLIIAIEGNRPEAKIQ